VKGFGIVVAALALTACGQQPDRRTVANVPDASSPAPEAQALPVDAPAMDSLNEDDYADENSIVPDEQVVVTDHP
jgi:hypothetical protein